MKQPNSFLIINTFGIGDVLFSTPLLSNLKENFGEAKIFYLCNRRVYPVLKNHPLIEKIFIYERDEFEDVRKQSKLAWLKKIFAFISDIRKEKIEVVLDLSLNSQFGFFAWFGGIKKRLGLDYKGRGRFLTDKIEINGYQDKHVVDYYLSLLNLLNIKPKESKLQVYADEVSKLWADNFIKDNGISNSDFLIGVAPCGGQAFGKDASVKRWPEDKFSALIDKLIEEFSAKVLIFAGPNEKREVSNIISGLNNSAKCFEFTDCSLDQIIAMIGKCKLFIGNDTGPLRFADALVEKVIGIFGPVDEAVYGLYPSDLANKRIIINEGLSCRPCYKKFRLPECKYELKCLRDISVAEVFDTATQLVTDDLKQNNFTNF
jgi:heptosyltransferase-2